MKHTTEALLRVRAMRARLALATLLLANLVASAHSLQGARYVVSGEVNLPDGSLAERVRVKITSSAGYYNETITDDRGRYMFTDIPAGRYHLSATNPSDGTMFTDPAETDTSQVMGNRQLRVFLTFRRDLRDLKKDAAPGKISVSEATQAVPKPARKAYEDALKRKADHKLDEAMTNLDRAIELYPAYFQALAERGQLRINLNRIAEAEADFEQALKIEENYEPALRGAGYCKLSGQKFSEALQYFDRAATADPNIATTHLFLGIANVALGKLEPAKSALKRALELDAKQTMTAHIYLADIFAAEHHYKEAADELSVYLKARPTAPNAERLKAKEADYRAKVSAPKN